MAATRHAVLSPLPRLIGVATPDADAQPALFLGDIIDLQRQQL